MVSTAGAMILLALLAGPADAIPTGIYQILDHGDGNQGRDYGLRRDSLTDPASVNTFSTTAQAGNGTTAGVGDFAFATLSWDGGATALISGTLRHNQDLISELWTVSYLISGITAVAGPAGGFTATDGFGSLTSPGGIVIPLTGKQDGGGTAFRFLNDGHRCPGSSGFGCENILGNSPLDRLVGRGWMLPSNTTDDWLITARLIPEPGTLGLLGAGLVGLGLMRRKRRPV
jgi:hypothetical protein